MKHNNGLQNIINVDNEMWAHLHTLKAHKTYFAENVLRFNQVRIPESFSFLKIIPTFFHCVFLKLFAKIINFIKLKTRCRAQKAQI